MKQYDVLVVEDDPSLSEALNDTLQMEGYRVLTAGNGTEAMAKLAEHRFRLVVSDVQMPVMNGFQLLQNLQAHYPAVPVLLMTAYGTVSKAVEAMRQGALDYLVKPFEASMLVEKVADFIAPEFDAAVAEERPEQDAAMKKLYQLMTRVAKTDVTVLLQGESGTGKEVVARYVHEHSAYRKGPFVAVNCAAIPENMLEAMLFGYEKGAFTGAVQAAPGKFETAQGGTLLLDEVGELNLALQAKLLRVLQEREVERIGSHKTIELNVRILAATNQKLKQSVESGAFREDLYYRLSVFPVKIPALRERPRDIVPLAAELLRRHSPAGKPIPSFEPSAQQKMLAYHWPGNVRELENVIQRALIFKMGDSISAGDLLFETDDVNLPDLPMTADRPPAEQPREAGSGGLGEQVRSAEEQMILQTLQDENGNRKQTAEKLGISPRTLRYKLARMKQGGIALPCSA